MKKAFLLSLDVIIAAGLILTFALFISGLSLTYSNPGLKYERYYYTAKDILNILRETKISHLQNYSTVSYYLDEGILEEEDLNKTLLDIVGSFWAEGNQTYAENITSDVLGPLLNGTGYGLELLADNESIYRRGPSSYRYLSRLSTIASGYSKGKPITSYIARAYLTELAKVTSQYIYFGGFVGEGNITRKLNLTGLNTTLSAEMELNAGGPFDLYINGNYSGSYTPSPGNMTADQFTVCNSTYRPQYCSLFTEHNNTITFNFTGNQSFIGGGFLRVSYNSTEMLTEEQTESYQFPGISGFINLFSSFYVPGQLEGMDVHLHYNNSYPTYLTIGNTTVYYSNITGEQTSDIDNSTLSGLLNYSLLSENTVPLRLGTEAVVPGGEGNADVVLITDVSGSMDWRLDSDSSGVERNCDDPNLYDPSTKRISLARCLDKEFVDNILNASGNRVGLVSYSGEPPYIGSSNVETIQSTHILSDNQGSLYSEIETYNPSGATGICGALRQARLMLENQSEQDRQKFIVMMSDGIPNVQCDPNQKDETDGCIPKICPENSLCLWWPWLCDNDYCYGVQGCLDEQCSDWVSQRASQDAIDDACSAHQSTNATVYSIGFGPVADCPIGEDTLLGIADCGNGSYYSSTQPEQLAEIYENISREIYNISYIGQKAEPEEQLMSNRLYGDSYISFNYTSTPTSLGYGEISLSLEGPRFGGNVTSPKNGSFYIPPEVQVVDAKATSYSSEYWTDRMRINNSITGNWTYLFRLWDFGTDYQSIGDPYLLHIPADRIATGETNYLQIDTAESFNSTQGGSPDDKTIFTVGFNGFVDYGGLYSKSKGSNKTVYYDLDQDGTTDGSVDITVGEPDIYDPNNDSIDNAFSRLLDRLNFINDTGEDDGSQANPINVKIFDIRFDSGSIGDIPSLWGPVELEIRVWM